MKIRTPMADKANSRAELLRKILTKEAMIKPIKPIIRNDPMPVKSFLVV